MTERVYKSIRGSILGDGLRPGAILSERELARRFRISKTPVREALIRLAHEGFVEISPRKGIHVPKISIGDLKEVFGIRSALEGLAAEEAASHIPLGTLVELRTAFRAAAKHGDQEDLFELGADLHDLIMTWCGNSRLANIVSTMRDQIAHYSRLASRLSGQADLSLRGHLKIIRALERKDGAAARRAVEEHIRGVKENLIRALL